MSFAQAVFVIIIALYAMVGGAFINAAITAPARCLQVLAWMWTEVLTTLLIGGIGFLVGGLLISTLSSSLEKAAVGFGLAVLGLAHLSLYILFQTSRKIAQAAMLPEEHTHLPARPDKAPNEPNP